ncbi:unnamed protein product [Arctogadus glacialis]
MDSNVPAAVCGPGSQVDASPSFDVALVFVCQRHWSARAHSAMWAKSLALVWQQSLTCLVHSGSGNHAALVVAQGNRRPLTPHVNLKLDAGPFTPTVN